MKVQYKKRFLKQLSIIPFGTRKRIEQFVFDELPSTTQIQITGRIEKMKGYEGYYKVRFGDYRVGIHKYDDVLVLKVAMHRKDIYKYFP